MIKIPKNFWSAETLLEVLIAMGVVASGAAIAANLAITALGSNQYNKDQLVALNIEQAGLEYVREIRDSNFLKFSYDKADCWDMPPNVTTCKKSLNLQKGDYAFEIEIGGLNQGLISQSTALDLKKGKMDNKNYVLKKVSFSNSSNKINFLSSLPLLLNNQKITDNGNSKFYMDINIKYSGSGTDLMMVTSTVEWLESGHVSQIKSSTILSNYKKWK